MHRAAANTLPVLCASGIAIALAGTPLAQTPTQFAVRTPAGIAIVALVEAVAADFDGDGDLDLCGGAAPSTVPTQRLLRNDGSERFTDVTATHLPASTNTTKITVAFDMDGDGDLDLFVSKAGPARLWRNTGQGVFVDVSANLPATAVGHVDVVAADFDGDGDVDLAGAGSLLSGSPNRMFVNNGSGVFTGLDAFPGNASNSIAAADFDGDGDQDLVLGTWLGPQLWRNDGGLSFTDVSGQWLPGLGTPFTRDVATGDVDGDGDPDLLIARSAVQDSVLRNVGTAFVVGAALSPTVGYTNLFSLADYDEDGDLDIMRSVNNSDVTLDVNDGGGAFTGAASRLPWVGAYGNLFVGADFDGDGDRDLLVNQVPSGIVLLVNRHRDLIPGPAAVGQNWTISVWSAPGYATLDHTCRLGIGLARLPQPLPIPAFGDLWLDLGVPYVAAGGIVFASAGTHQFSFPVPPFPQLIGLQLHVQGLIEQARAPAHFTAYRSVVVQ